LFLFRLTVSEQAELDLAIKLSKEEETVQLTEISIELPNLSNDKQEKNVSSAGTNKSPEQKKERAHHKLI